MLDTRISHSSLSVFEIKALGNDQLLNRTRLAFSEDDVTS